MVYIHFLLLCNNLPQTEKLKIISASIPVVLWVQSPHTVWLGSLLRLSQTKIRALAGALMKLWPSSKLASWQQNSAPCNCKIETPFSHWHCSGPLSAPGGSHSALPCGLVYGIIQLQGQQENLSLIESVTPGRAQPLLRAQLIKLSKPRIILPVDELKVNWLSNLIAEVICHHIHNRTHTQGEWII